MEKSKILYVTQEINPFLIESEISNFVRKVAQGVHESNKEIRIFMPRFGVINERRHQLHEVIRLSGMNLVINDLDMPLIIKVASIPKERMQVYFIDNEEYFKRRSLLHNDKGKLHADNDERMIFFTKGVIETVKKLNWSPDIIHLHGWFTALFPLYLNTYYKDEPIFADSKIVTSIYKKDFIGVVSKKIKSKVEFDLIPKEEIEVLSKSNFNNLIKLSIKHSDGIVSSSKETPNDLNEIIDESKKPHLGYDSSIEKNAYIDFYTDKII